MLIFEIERKDISAECYQFEIDKLMHITENFKYFNPNVLSFAYIFFFLNYNFCKLNDCKK